MRRRTDHRRHVRGARRRRRIVGTLLVVAVVGGLGAAVGADALVVRASLADAETAVDDARSSLLDGQVARARDRLVDARRDLEAATRRTNRALWRTAERVPVAGANLATLADVVDVVDRGSGVAAGVVGALEPLLGADGTVVVQPEDGQLPVAVLEAAGAAAGALDPSSLEDALARLRTPRGPVLEPIAAARDRVLALGTETARTLGAAVPIAETLPTFLGADGPRRYLLGMQNPAELRGTGGLIGFTAELEVLDGRLSISQPQSYSALDALGREADGALPAVATAEVFAARYAAQNAAGFLGNVNVDPHLPTTGPVLLDLIEDRTGRAFDGLVLVDPLAVAHILARIGPVDVDPEIAATAPSLPATVTPDRFADLVMVEHYAAFEGRNAARRAWLSDVASAAFTRIFDARWDGATVTRAIVDAAGAGHLAVHLREPSHQAAFEAADLAGALRPPAVGDDVLAITANNSAGNKLDRHVAHATSGTVVLEGDPTEGSLRRTATLEVAVENPVEPGELSLYVEGSFPPSRGERTPRSADRGLARTWWSVWTPALDQLTLDTPEGPRTGSWVIHDQRVVDGMVETPAGTRGSITATARGVVAVEDAPGGYRYRLHLRRQPKAIADQLAIEFRPPDGWRIAGGRVRGGAADVGVTGEAPMLLVDDGAAAHLAGGATSNLVVELDLARS